MTQNTINTGNLYIQLVTASTIATTATTTSFPNDNSIPQITEGEEIITATITPVSASSTLVIRYTCEASVTTQNLMQMGLFQDTTADALAALGIRYGAPVAKMGELTHVMTSGTTSSTTFRIRMGNVSSAENQINVNSAGTRYMGGVSYAWLTIEEYL